MKQNAPVINVVHELVSSTVIIVPVVPPGEWFITQFVQCWQLTATSRKVYRLSHQHICQNVEHLQAAKTSLPNGR